MPHAFVLAVACTLLFFSGSATAEAQAKEGARPGTPAAVLAAVERLLSRPVADAVRPEFSIVLDFADASDEVLVTLAPSYFDFSGNDTLDHPLLAYYVAGAVKFDLEHPALSQDVRADLGSAVRAGLVYYRTHRSAHPGDSHPLFEKFDRLEKQGALDRYLAELPADAE